MKPSRTEETTSEISEEKKPHTLDVPKWVWPNSCVCVCDLTKSRVKGQSASVVLLLQGTAEEKGFAAVVPAKELVL